jgi:hypothetical protein
MSVGGKGGGCKFWWVGEESFGCEVELGKVDRCMTCMLCMLCKLCQLEGGEDGGTVSLEDEER